MDAREEKEKLKALNLLNCLVEVETGGARVRGEVFFFNEKALILRKEREYVFVNVCKHEEVKLTVLQRSDRTQLREAIE